jgi:hypothetical protein
MITVDFIKKTLEGFANVEDISLKSRKRPLPDLRYTYMALCRHLREDIENYSLYRIGKCINRNHATVIHGLKEFDNLYGTKSFYGNDIYKKSLAFLLNHIEGLDIPEEIKRDEVVNHYRVKHIMLSEKYRDVINKQQRKIDLLTKNKLLVKVSELNEDVLDELEIKLDAFFKVNKFKQ